MYNNKIYGEPTMISGSTASLIWVIVSLVLALVGAFVVYFLFVKSKKKFDNNFLEWLKSFLDFQSMLIEPILKISYIFVSAFITLSSFATISTSFIGFLIYLIGGNILARIIYETSMILISIWQNTKEINKKLK